MAFTSWADLERQMLDDLASGSWRRKSYSLGDLSVSYVSFGEFKEALEYVRNRAALERGTASPRTCARPAGGGRW